MSRPATSRLKVNPPMGRMPVLQFMAPSELAVDPTYQRELDTGPSQTLIRKIAQFWNWDLCQPLVVSRRGPGELFVIDGQHRLEAARLRRDIAQLPCVVVDYASAADEAASFVHLNQQRRPLTKLDLFKAAVASEDPESCAIAAAIVAAGLRLAPHSNPTAWKPGMLANVGGIQRVWRQHGETVAKAALVVLAQAYKGEALRYAGTIFPGVAALLVAQPDADAGEIARVLGKTNQIEWKNRIIRHAGEVGGDRREAARHVIGAAWSARKSPPLRPASRPVAPIEIAPEDGRKWCEQCERRVSARDATLCRSQFCRVRPRLTA